MRHCSRLPLCLVFWKSEPLNSGRKVNCGRKALIWLHLAYIWRHCCKKSVGIIISQRLIADTICKKKQLESENILTSYIFFRINVIPLHKIRLNFMYLTEKQIVLCWFSKWVVSQPFVDICWQYGHLPVLHCFELFKFTACYF